jgi:O-antigen ligase
MKIILFFAILFVQINSTQYLSAILLFAVLGWSIINNLLAVQTVRKKALWAFFGWLLMIVVMIRPDYLHLPETKIEILWLSLGCLAFLIVSTGNKIKRIPVIKTVILSGMLGAFINLAAHLLNWFNTRIVNTPYAGTRWVGGFDGPNEFGAFYVMILALVLGLYLEKEYSFLKMVTLSFILIILIYFSFSRGALLGLVGLLVIFAIYSLVRSKRKFLLFGFYIVIVSVFLYRYLQPLLMKFNSVRENASERDILFLESFRLLKESPILGHGLGAFGELSFVKNTTPHSDYLLILVSGGLIGCGLLLFFYSKFTWNAFKNKFYPELLLLLVFISQAFTFNNIVRGRLSILFWVIVILLYLGKNVETEEISTKNKRLRLKKYKLTW